ncbi:arylesterase [Oceanidesulfovibrio marinus]|uniref:Arylesterase n=1 Tax=Oceanidesulfovibrio marinus TaxID=370038 RepID=A0A6P1ZA64_9BACT|nr:arylesterase [Oceanidesulfovibrio marinus]QJT10736.1 arylesterase [Oceanidesulfovibrio marinus]TVM30383.1 arylesterase [Oceanidesulfovibrio marinus]
MGDPVTILAFGDSLTAGYGLNPGESVPDILQTMLHDNGYNVTIVNAGYSGDTTTGGLARLPWTLDRSQPDAAILELGANDGLQGQDPTQMEANLNAMLDLFQQHSIPVLFTGMQAMPNLGEAYAQEFAAVFPRIAEQRDLLFYPFFLEGVGGIPALNQGDGIHPNAEGARLIAKNLYPYVVQLIEKAQRLQEAG